ncbi:putative T7SS-secreted protein [Streptomyces sp. NPDC048248]|uniref:putative T7SS-secreted protein n=1 Tax=Streptomyces sp. NPDC048248 TaxID=3365523 RepID=UPI00371926F2
MSWKSIFIADDDAWPGLTFNPAKGDLHTVKSLAFDVKSVGDELDELHDLLKGVGKADGVWDGEAAEKFKAKLDKLPRYLQQGSESMRDCARALHSWESQLGSLQSRAKGLEADAVEARSRAEHSRKHYNALRDRAEDQMGAVVDSSDKDVLSDKALGDAYEAAENAQSQLDDIIKKAEELRSRWDNEAGVAERAILKASENHPPDLHWWDYALDGLRAQWRGFKDWLADHADLLSNISAVLSILSLATMAIPPVGAILGGLAIGASALALAGYGVKASRGGKVGVMDWVGAGLGVVPGVGAVKGLKAAGSAAKAAGAVAKGEKVVAAGAGMAKSEHMARGMADGLMHTGIKKAASLFQKEGAEALDVAHWGARGTQMGVKGFGLEHRLEANWPADKPLGKAFLTAAGA